MKYDGKNSVAFDALVEVFPSIELKGFEGLEFKKDEVSQRTFQKWHQDSRLEDHGSKISPEG